MKIKTTNFIFFIFFLFIRSTAFSQNENNIWYFGQNAGLDFNSGSPVPLTNGALNTWEGCASAADPVTGSLLFYTDGEQVWNRNHTLMPNGTGLWGQYSSTQSSLIVPKPGSSTLYYLFTTDAGTGGFQFGGVMGYSVIDMSLAAGFGDVTVKNIALFDTTSEQLTATRSADGCKVWVLAHKWQSNEFYAYLVSDTGISAPVISAAGSVHQCAYYGQMKVSPDGTKLAIPLPCDAGGNYVVELFNFDNSTGTVSGAVQLPQDHAVYGLEFSPGSRFLYTVDHNNSAAILYKQIGQYDVTLGSSAAINASRVIVGAVWNVTTFFNGAAQLAPDGKIYIVPTSGDSLCVVNDPDSAGLACNFIVPGIYLGGPLNDHGLPNRVVTAEFPCAPPVALFSAPNHLCPGTCTDFVNLSVGATSFVWIFAGASPSSSTDLHPTGICYQSPGVYNVTLIASNPNGSDTLTLTNYMTVYPYPPPQGITQQGDTLFANPGAVSYQWYFNGNILAGATDYIYVAYNSGDYNVVATDGNGCEVEAAIFDVTTNVRAVDAQAVRIHAFPGGNHLLLEAPFPVVEFSLGNVLGEIVESSNTRTMDRNAPVNLMLQDLSPGLYLIRLYGSNSETAFAKFIVPAR